jgi:hypothetical protein
MSSFSLSSLKTETLSMSFLIEFLNPTLLFFYDGGLIVGFLFSLDVSKKQDSQCGDGTTGVVVLAAELLRNAETLINQKIHPQVKC